MTKTLITILVLVFLGLMGVSSAANVFQQALPGYHYQFPRDHGSHNAFKTEWWYYTGHLQAKSGETFGYELTFFRLNTGLDELPDKSAWALQQGYPAHFAISDNTNKRFMFWERLSRGALGLSGADTGRYHVWNKNWQVYQKGNDHYLSASEKGQQIRLRLTPVKPLVIHGKNGVSQKANCKGCASHYYSYTRMKTEGILSLDGKTLSVSGLSWMDHEFGSNQLTADQAGWDWFSIQLDTQEEIMLYMMRRKDGKNASNVSGTYITKEGNAIQLSAKDFQVRSLAYWKSPTTKAVYPAGWEIKLPTRQITLNIKPVFYSQELVTRASTNTAYWEGNCMVNGQIASKRITGKAYVELTGYDQPFKQTL